MAAAGAGGGRGRESAAGWEAEGGGQTAKVVGERTSRFLVAIAVLLLLCVWTRCFTPPII